jgi:serine/threonine protein kinase
MLLGDNDEIKLADFGSAKKMDLKNVLTFTGSIPYMSPEMWSTKYSYPTDIWFVKYLSCFIVFVALSLLVIFIYIYTLAKILNIINHSRWTLA